MQWSNADNLLHEAVNLIGPLRLDKKLGNTLQNPKESLGTTPNAPAAEVRVDDRDQMTVATDLLLEQWTGIPNPILESEGEEFQHFDGDTKAVLATAVPSESRQILEYDKGQFYMAPAPPNPLSELIAPKSNVALLTADTGSQQEPLSEEEIKRQGDAICEAVNWLVSAQHKDRAIEEMEALLVRARLSEVTQCEGVIDLIQSEIEVRRSTIALIYTQMAQINDLRTLALRQNQQREHIASDGENVSMTGDEDRLYGDFDENEMSVRSSTLRGNNKSRQNGIAVETLKQSPTSSEPFQGSRGRRTPIGPTPPPSAIRQKMSAFTHGNHAQGKISSLAAADEVLRAASASAGPLRAATLSEHRSSSSALLHQDKHRTAMDAKIAAKVRQIHLQNPIF